MKVRIRFMIALGMIVMMPLAASGAYFETHRFDIDANSGNESFPGGYTEPGWTSVNDATAATPTTAGFILGDSHIPFGGAIFRDPADTTPPGVFQYPVPVGQPPIGVLQEVLIGAGQGTGSSEPTIRFRDITPAGARRVTITIYRSDPMDTFHAIFDSRYSRNGEAFITFDPGHGVVAYYHPPVVLNLALDERLTTGELDLAFFDTGFGGFGSQVRINGLVFVYEIPEPATVSLLTACSALLLRRRR